MSQDNFQVVIGLSIIIGMAVFGTWMLIDSIDDAKKADEYYLKQFATNQTWVDSLDCNDISMVYIGRSTPVFQAKSAPLFKNLGIEKECPQFEGGK